MFRLTRDEAEQHISGIIRFRSAQIFTAATFRLALLLVRSLNGKYTIPWRKSYPGKYNRCLVLYFYIVKSLLPIGEDKLP